MKNNPLVSIIIPTYNRAHLIGETLDSIVAQTYENWECIIVDDGSTDNTEEVVNKYIKKDKRFQYHLRPAYHKPGGNGARNYGFKLSKGEFIQWFDSDDLMKEGHLLRKIEIINKKNIDFVACSLQYFECDDNQVFNVLYEKKTKLFNKPFGEFLKGNLTLRLCSPLWNKKFLNGKLLFDENLLRSQEWDLFSRLLLDLKGYDVIDETLIQVRNHRDNISSKFQEGDVLKIMSDLKAKKKIYSLAKSMRLMDDEIIFIFSNKIVALLKIGLNKVSTKQKIDIITLWIKMQIDIVSKKYHLIFFNLLILVFYLVSNRGINRFKYY